MDEKVEGIMEIQNDGRWLQSNYSRIRRKYENKFIAVKNKRVIAKSDDLKSIIRDVKEKGIDPALILIEFIHEKGFELLL